jgi:hypothetical protein
MRRPVQWLAQEWLRSRQRPLFEGGVWGASRRIPIGRCLRVLSRPFLENNRKLPLMNHTRTCVHAPCRVIRAALAEHVDIHARVDDDVDCDHHSYRRFRIAFETYMC